MLSIIKDTYKLFLRKLPVWILFILPLIIYSVGDDYLRANFAECRSYFYLSLCLSPLVYCAVEIAIYKYVMKVEIGKFWGFIKKWILFIIIQFVMGFVMMTPMFVLSKIMLHHNINSYWIPFGLIANIFVGIWLFAKVNVLLPMIMSGEKITFKSYMVLAKGGYLSWVLVSAFIYFPYVAAYYLIGNPEVNIVVTSLFSVVICLFNSLYYMSAKK